MLQYSTMGLPVLACFSITCCSVMSSVTEKAVTHEFCKKEWKKQLVSAK